jgi:hypothetical protein
MSSIESPIRLILSRNQSKRRLCSKSRLHCMLLYYLVKYGDSASMTNADAIWSLKQAPIGHSKHRCKGLLNKYRPFFVFLLTTIIFLRNSSYLLLGLGED